MVFAATKTSDGVVLRIHAQGEIPVSRVTEYLNALEYAYNSAYVFERHVEQESSFPGGVSVSGSIASSSVRPQRTPLLWNAWLNPTPEKIAALVPKSDRLQLKGVVLQSPGFWDLLGALNPLNFILEYLKLSHEQSKDKEYRNQEEARKLWLENEILRTEMIERKMKLLREAGRTDYELQILAEQLLVNPIQQLGEFQVRGEIRGAEIVSLEESSSAKEPSGSLKRVTEVDSDPGSNVYDPEITAVLALSDLFANAQSHLVIKIPSNLLAEIDALYDFSPGELQKLKKGVVQELSTETIKIVQRYLAFKEKSLFSSPPEQ